MAARKLHKLSARDIARLSKVPGRHGDGGNLYLEVTPQLSASKAFISKMTGHRGWGSDLSPAAWRGARERAAEWRALIVRGINPREADTAATTRRTFGQCADAFTESKQPEWSTKHAKAWEASIKIDCAPIRDLPVDEVDTTAVLGVLQPIWSIKHVTASRTRSRIELVLDSAKALGERTGENPARWRGHLALILPKRSKLDKSHHAALPYDRVPAFIVALSKLGTVAASALEFAIFTAARRGEAIGATWGEIDLNTRIWTVPAARMKGRRTHRVPLSDAALAVLERMAAIRRDDGFVFPGRDAGRPLEGRTVWRLCGGIDGTAHGFRSSFHDWASDTGYAREVIEAALAHLVGDATEQAYARSDALHRRSQMMAAWADFGSRK